MPLDFQSRECEFESRRPCSYVGRSSMEERRAVNAKVQSSILAGQPSFRIRGKQRPPGPGAAICSVCADAQGRILTRPGPKFFRER